MNPQPPLIITEDETSIKVRKAIAHLLMSKETSWWGFIICTFDLKVSSNIPTMGISFNIESLRPIVYYAPSFIQQLKIGEIAAVLIHESLHFLQMVFLRQGIREMMEWNIAADMPINWQIDTTLGTKATHDWAKQIHLPDKWQGEQGQECQAVRVPLSISNEQRYAEWLYDNLHKNEDLKKTMKEFGTKYFLIDDHSLWGNFNKIPEEVLKHTIIRSINDATANAGTQPNGISEILDKLLDSKVGWDQEIKDFVGQNQVIGTRMSWKKPSRRFGTSQPGKLVLKSGIIVFILDTSGSMSKEELMQGLGEADAISSRFEVWVIDCDADVQHVYKYHRGIELEVKGRGGTNLNPGLLHAEETLHADMIICFTDGHLCETPIQTKASQLWVITNTGTENYIKDRRFVRLTND